MTDDRISRRAALVADSFTIPETGEIVRVADATPEQLRQYEMRKAGMHVGSEQPQTRRPSQAG